MSNLKTTTHSFWKMMERNLVLRLAFIFGFFRRIYDQLYKGVTQRCYIHIQMLVHKRYP